MLRGFTRSTEIRLLKFEYMPFFLQNSALGIHERLPIVEQRAAQLWDEKNSVGALNFHKFLFCRMKRDAKFEIFTSPRSQMFFSFGPPSCKKIV